MEYGSAWRVFAVAMVCLGASIFQSLPAATTPLQVTELRGVVSGIDGTRVQIQIESRQQPRIGDRVKFSQLIPGFEGPVSMRGEWVITGVTAEYVWAEPGDGAEQSPGRGYIAVIHTKAPGYEKIASDPLHALLWTKSDDIEYNGWFDADLFCQQLKLADLADWFMPTVDQLEGLHGLESAFQHEVLDDNRYAWSSASRSERRQRYATAFDFQSGKQLELKVNKKTRYYPWMVVLCVHPYPES